jgi:anti-sigma B factor antagonist
MQSIFPLSGEIDIATRSANRQAAERFWADAEGPVWLIDLSDVSFMDSTGLGLLAEFYREARRRGVSVTLRLASPALLRLITITGMGSLFEIEPPIHAGSDEGTP